MRLLKFQHNLECKHNFSNVSIISFLKLRFPLGRSASLLEHVSFLVFRRRYDSLQKWLVLCTWGNI